MRRIVSTIVLVAFLSCQTSAYGQQLAYPVSNNGTSPSSHRQINMSKTSYLDSKSIERDKAMMEAIFEAQYEHDRAAKGERDYRRLKGPVSGKREGAILSKDRYNKAKSNSPPHYSRQESKEDKKERRQIRLKQDVPNDAELGSGIVRDINEAIYPVKISGEYQASWGYDWGDEDSEGGRGTWKNADFNKSNLVYVLDNQYIFGNDRENTYDQKIYDRFRLRIESVREKGFNILSETVVDPWSFVGKTDSIVVTGSNGNQLPVQMRYWSNSQSTIDQRTWLSSGADFANIPEIKVNGGSTHATSIASRWANERFDLPPMEINRDFRPMRKLETNFTSDRINFKLFALADHDHAYTSDDPLTLSNNRIFWEPSPWLKRWDPAVYYGPSNDFQRGAWRDDIAFESRDSDFNFLTLLRGVSFDWNFDDTYIGGATAAPLTLWQDYASVNTLPGALRFKQLLFPGKRYYVGGIYTYNYGFDGGHVDAYNQTFGVDAGYEIKDFINFRGEVAWSKDKRDAHGNDPNISPTRDEGTAFRLESEGEFFKDRGGNPQLKAYSSYTHMGDGFKPALSNYRNTRYDEFWSKHISFEPVDWWYNKDRLGDGVDAGRNVYRLGFESMLFEGKLTSLSDARFVRGDSGDKIENVYRQEVTVKPLGNLATKFLFRYQDLPTTSLSRDPFILTDFISLDNTDEFMFNTDIAEGEDADVWTWSGGVHYDPVKWFGMEGIYERTNDYETYPNRVLNDAGFRDLGQIRELNYFLFSQPLIAIPPYDPYNIYKARIFYSPLESFRTKFEYVINEFKHATGRDDNISHWGVEIDMDVTEKLTSSFKFVRSQVVDLFAQQQLFADVPFNHHNNFFAEVRYAIDDDNSLIAQFGEFATFTSQYTPVPWMLNTLDTQRIVRLYFKGRF